LFEKAPDIKQKEQRRDTKLRQGVAVTLTQAKQEVMTENEVTRIFNLTEH
jgi:hypothetical protein